MKENEKKEKINLDQEKAPTVTFSNDIEKMSVSQFLKEANNVLGLKEFKLKKEELMVIDFFINSKELNILNLSHEGTKSIYFFSPKQKRYIPLNFENFTHLIGEQSYKLSYLKFLYANLEFNILTRTKRRKDHDFLYNIKFDNGTLISKNHNVYWKDEKELSFNNIHMSPYIKDDTSNWVKEHKHFALLMKYLRGISAKNYNFFIDILASIFLPNSLTASIFWIKSEGGKGKSSFFSWLCELIGGAENVSNLKIDDFIPKGNKPNYNLPYLNGKLMNFDDDYSGLTITSSGFLKQFATGKNRVQVDYKQNQPISFYPKAALFIATNESPVFKTFDSGDKRRNLVFEWEGNWEEEGINDFAFFQDKEFQKLFLTIIVHRAILISNKIKNDKEIYSKVGYYIHNAPEGVVESTKNILTEEFGNINKVNDYINNGEKIVEFEYKDIFYIDVLETHKHFTNTLKAIGEKMNYKDFLKALQNEGYISTIAERIPYGEDDKKKMVYRRLK